MEKYSHAITFAIIQASRIIKRMSAVCLHKLEGNIRLCAWYTGLQPETVKKWILQSQSESYIFDKERSGRPKKFDQAVFIKTIAFYCQPAPLQQDTEVKLSLRWAADYLSSHPLILIMKYWGLDAQSVIQVFGGFYKNIPLNLIDINISCKLPILLSSRKWNG